MTDLKVTYFDFPGSRGEEVRLALTLAGQPFDDNRISRETFARLKPDLPFGSVPTLEVAGHGVFAQSNAILRLIGRLHGLHPDDPYEAARHDALMGAAEDLRHRIAPTTRIQDDAERKAARQDLAANYIPLWGRCIERMLGEGPFVAGAKPSMADIKLYMLHRWVTSGTLDDIPGDVLGAFPRLNRLAESFGNLPAVQSWYAAVPA